MNTTLLNIAQITTNAARQLSDALSKAYEVKVTYEVRSAYGKFRVTKVTHKGSRVVETEVVARKLTREAAEGIVKLLKEE